MRCRGVVLLWKRMMGHCRVVVARRRCLRWKSDRVDEIRMMSHVGGCSNWVDQWYGGGRWRRRGSGTGIVRMWLVHALLVGRRRWRRVRGGMTGEMCGVITVVEACGCTRMVASEVFSRMHAADGVPEMGARRRWSTIRGDQIAGVVHVLFVHPVNIVVDAHWRRYAGGGVH